jgi:Peptidase family M48
LNSFEESSMDSIRQSSFQTTQRLRPEPQGVPTRPDEGADQDGRPKDGFCESLELAEELNDEEEQEEGERHERELLEKYPLWHSDLAELLFDVLFVELSKHMARPELEYAFLALDTEVPFASSCPNGAIYFTRGLLQSLTREAVLFLAAHELAHTELRHYASRKRRLSELRQIIPAPIGSPTRQRLDVAAVLCVRHQEEFEADYQAALWVGSEIGVEALTTLHHLCRAISPESLQRPTHPPFERRVASLREGLPFPSPLKYLYSLVG